MTEAKAGTFNHVSSQTDLDAVPPAPSEEQFRLVLEASPDGFTILRSIRDETGTIADFNIAYANPSAARGVNRTPTELIGQSLLQLFPDCKTDGLFDRYVAVAETGVSQTFETFYESKNLTGWFRNVVVKLNDGIAVSSNDVTERKRAEDERRRAELALQQQQQHFRVALQTAKLGSWEHDLMTGVLTCSAQCKANFGLPSDAEFTHETLFAVLHPDDRPLVQAAIQRCLEERTDYSVEERCYHPDGSLHWLIVRGRLVYGSEGTPIRLVGVTLDITERKQTEIALRESQELFESFMRHSPIAAFIKDETGRYLYANPWVERIYQRSQTDLIGKTDFDLLPPAIAEQVHQNDIAVLSKNQPMQMLEKAHHEDGEHCYMSFKFPFQTASGQQLLAGVAIDISERVQAEAVLQRYQLLAEHSRDVVLYLGKDGRILEANRAAEQAYGYTRLELLSLKIADLRATDTLPVLPQQFEQAIREGILFETIHRRKDGSQFPVEVSAQSAAIEGDLVVLSIIRDITERKCSEVTLRQSEERLRLAMAGAQMGTWDVDLITRKAIWSEQHFTMLGYEPSTTGEATEEMWSSRIHPDDLEQVIQEWQQSQQEHRVYRTEYRVVRADNGQVAWLSALGSFTYDQTNQAVRSIGVLFDITSRKQTEMALVAEEQRYRYIFETVGVSIWEEDFSDVKAAIDQLKTEGVQDFRQYFIEHPEFVQQAIGMIHLRDVNQTSLQLFGAHTKTNLLNSLHQIFTPVAQEAFIQELLALAAEETYFSAETVLQTLQGEQLHVWFSMIFPASSELYDRVLVSLLDITDRKQAEKALQESEERTRLAIQVGQLGQWQFHLDTNLIEIDERMGEIWGEPPDVEMLSLAEVMERVHPNDRARVTTAVDAALDPTSTGRYEIDYRIIWEDGTERWVFANGQVLFNYEREARQPIRFFGTALDITDRKRMEKNLTFLAEIMADFAPLTTADEIMQVACTKTIAYFNVSRCLFVKISDEMDEAEVVYDCAVDALSSLIGTYQITDFHTPDEVQELSAGRAIVVNDVADMGRSAEAIDRFTQLQIGSLVNAPYVSNGQWKFVLSVMQTKPRIWCSDEIELLQELSARVWLRIERAHAETALRKSETKYRSLFESMDEGFCILQLIFDEVQQPIDYRFIEINPSFERQTGLNNALGKTMRELVPDIEPFWFDIYGKVALTGEPTHFVDHAASMDRWFDVNAFRTGKPHEHKVAVLFSDISDRKRAEAAVAADLRDTQRLRDLSAQLTTEADSQLLYNEILATAITLMQADAGSMQVLDTNTQELLLLATQGFSPLMAQYFGRVNVHFNTSCGLSLVSGQRSFVDFDVPEKDDLNGYRQLHVEAGLLSAQSTPLVSRSGKLLGMVSTHWRTRHRPSDRELRFLDLLARQAADLLEQRQAEAQRRQLLAQEQAAREEAERANRIKDEFLAVLSHELRSPLNPILGWSTLLLNKKLDEAKTAHALATIQRNAKLQAELIEDLLDVSRILRGKLSLTVAPVDLASTIRGALETVRLAAEAKSIQVEAYLEPEVGLVLGDTTRLQQVVWNLLSNAVKFTPTGGQVSVKLATNRATDETDKTVDPSDSSVPKSVAQITVRDTGQGITPDFLPYVFDYFRQADGATTRKFGGLGLGLAIVRHLVELHGGTVEADSLGEGQGATFTVRLPLMQTPSNQRLDEPSPESPLDLQYVKILVVDDDADAREFVTFLLEQQGAQVVAVSSAHEALAALPQAKPDILLSDIGMPDMDGYMLIQQVRTFEREQGGQIPAIALTAYAGEINQQQALAAGFQKHLPKPIEPERLLQMIASLLRSV